ncbi:unnamed protein product [Discosporangium mesarthrocarpum]
MSRVCMVTGKKPVTGNNVSHANNKTRRRFSPNLHSHRFWVESEKRFVKLRVSTKGMRIIDKLGIDSVLTDIRSRGVQLNTIMRDKIKLVSSAGTGHFYTTDKNKRNMPDKMEIKKFDPVVRKHVIYKESKIK